MTRNLEERVELTCPIFGAELKEQIKTILEIHWRDNTKARLMDATQSNHYKKRGNKKKVRSQLAIYDYLKAKNLKANESGSKES